MNQLLSAAVTDAATQAEHFVGNTFGERTLYALSHTGVGMLIVFAVLAVIWAILAVFKMIFGGKSAKKEKEAAAPEKKSEPAPTAKAPATAAAAPVVPTSSDAEIVAAITAAITLMREAEGKAGTFRVVSFRRTGGARPWNQA